MARCTLAMRKGKEGSSSPARSRTDRLPSERARTQTHVCTHRRPSLRPSCARAYEHVETVEQCVAGYQGVLHRCNDTLKCPQKRCTSHTRLEINLFLRSLNRLHLSPDVCVFRFVRGNFAEITHLNCLSVRKKSVSFYCVIGIRQ